MLWVCHNLTIMNNMAINILVYVSFCSWLFISMEYISISVIAKSTGIYIFYFNFLLFLFFYFNCHVSFQKNVTNPIADGWMDAYMCVSPKTGLYICLCNFVSPVLANWYITSTLLCLLKELFHFSTGLSFSSFKCSVYDYVYNPFVFCITNTFSKFIIYLWLWLWYQIP